MKAYAVYLRVSTHKQGRSGLGLDAQRKMCKDFIATQDGDVAKEFVDVESGTHRERKGLLNAINYCKQNNCPLVIAKLDRLARDVEFCFKVVNTGIEIHFTDMLQMNTLLLGVFASVAQYERELTSDRTKKALAVKKAQGCKLGSASEKYQENLAKKSLQEIKETCMKRGLQKRQRYQASRDIQATLRVLRNVFPEATKNEDPAKWLWGCINTRGENKNKILNMMHDYQGLDESHALYRKWDFSAGTDDAKLCAKMRAFLQRVQLSFTHESEEED